MPARRTGNRSGCRIALCSSIMSASHPRSCLRLNLHTVSRALRTTLPEHGDFYRIAMRIARAGAHQRAVGHRLRACCGAAAVSALDSGCPLPLPLCLPPSPYPPRSDGARRLSFCCTPPLHLVGVFNRDGERERQQHDSLANSGEGGEEGQHPRPSARLSFCCTPCTFVVFQ